MVLRRPRLLAKSGEKHAGENRELKSECRCLMGRDLDRDFDKPAWSEEVVDDMDDEFDRMARAAVSRAKTTISSQSTGVWQRRPASARPAAAGHASPAASRPMSARERNRQAQEEKELEKKAKERARQQRMARQYVKADPAAAKEKQAARLFAIPINQWGVGDVCQWVDYIGYGQHKLKFAHHHVDGRLLMRLTAQHLKDDLNIAIFGHREALVEAIARLKSESAKPGVAASAPPTNDVTAEKSGMMAAKAEKLRLRLKAIETQELQMKAMKAQTEAEVKKYEFEAARVERQTDGARKTKRRMSLPSAPEAMLGGSWKFSITFKEPGAEFKELVNTKATFQPEINKNSLRILQETMGRDGEGKDFLSRLETDIKVRKTKLRDREKHYLTLASGGVDEVRAREKREENFLREALQEKLGKTYKTITDDVIDSVLSEVDPSQLGLNEKQCESMKKLVDTAKREELEKEVADAIQDKDKQDAQLKLHRFNKLVKKKRRAWLQECLRTNNFLSRWSTDLETRKSRLEQTANTLDEIEKQRKSTVPLPAVKAPTPADVQAREFYRQRLGWWDPTDEQRSKDRKALPPGDPKAEELQKEEQTVLCTRLNLLLDLALDERGLMDRTQMRRETPGGGAELGRLACMYGVPRFVPSTTKQYFRMVEDLGLDEVVHLLAFLAKDRLQGLRAIPFAKLAQKELAVFKAVKLQLFVYCMQRDSELRTRKIAEAERKGPGVPGSTTGGGESDRLQESVPNVQEFILRMDEDLRRRREKVEENGRDKDEEANFIGPKWRK